MLLPFDYPQATSYRLSADKQAYCVLTGTNTEKCDIWGSHRGV